jgi:hypothetical protein
MKKQKEDQPEVTRLQKVIENSSRILEIDWQRSTNMISGKKVNLTNWKVKRIYEENGSKRIELESKSGQIHDTYLDKVLKIKDLVNKSESSDLEKAGVAEEEFGIGQSILLPKDLSITEFGVSEKLKNGKKSYKQGGILFITFKGGKKYGYIGVKAELVQELFDAPSLGKFFDEHIKGKYNWFKVPSGDSGKPLEINIIQNKD